MKRVPVMVSVAAAVCSLVACKKDLEEVKPTASATVSATATRPEQLTAAAWHQTGLVVKTTNDDKSVASADLFGHIQPGMLDKLATFSAGGGYSVLKGGDGAQPQQGTWKLNAASDSLTIALPSHVRHLAVADLSPTTLSLSFADVADNGKVSTYTLTYAH